MCSTFLRNIFIISCPSLFPVAECQRRWEWWILWERRTKCWPAWGTLEGGSGRTSWSLECSAPPQSGTSWSSLSWMRRLYLLVSYSYSAVWSNLQLRLITGVRGPALSQTSAWRTGGTSVARTLGAAISMILTGKITRKGNLTLATPQPVISGNSTRLTLPRR